VSTQRVWFTADTHLGHNNIIRYCKRPFSSHEEMEEVMLERFNKVLRKGDLLYHLGDVAWSEYELGGFFGRLNTRSVHLILGNHDNRKEEEYKRHFQWVGQGKKVNVERVPVLLYHYPIRSWQSKGRGGYHLYGHCHGTVEPGLDRSMDVGVDTHNYSPWSWDEVHERLKDIPMFSTHVQRDHHNTEVRG
jgi:calcineurin-like phosphoesterase family protein